MPEVYYKNILKDIKKLRDGEFFSVPLDHRVELFILQLCILEEVSVEVLVLAETCFPEIIKEYKNQPIEEW